MNIREHPEKFKEDEVIKIRKDERQHLTFVKVAENTYRVFNKRTGRFHDLDLGIDVVF